MMLVKPYDNVIKTEPIGLTATGGVLSVAKVGVTPVYRKEIEAIVVQPKMEW
jgi:hypothetical protein